MRHASEADTAKLWRAQHASCECTVRSAPTVQLTAAPPDNESRMILFQKSPNRMRGWPALVRRLRNVWERPQVRGTDRNIKVYYSISKLYPYYINSLKYCCIHTVSHSTAA